MTKPGGLNLTRKFRYVHHSSYSIVIILVLSNLAYAKVDGVPSCWVPPEKQRTLSVFQLTVGGCILFICM